MRTGISITITRSVRGRLEAITRDRNASQKHAWRAAIILSSADGVGTNEIMRRTGKSKTCVWRWQERFMKEGIAGLLHDKTRPSRIPPLGPEVAARVVALTLADPPVETTHWTADLMARASGISASAVRRIWKAHGLQPHRYRQFKLSNDPNFVDKLRDVVGLYVDPPAHAIVLSLDEKSQIQALDRTQPGLPLKKGRLGTMTHDYKRHGTTTLARQLDAGLARKPESCKGYTIGDNTHKDISRYPWRMDDEKVAYKGYEKMVAAGIKNVCVHKGLFAPGIEKQFPHLRGFSDVADVGQAAKDWPQLNFVIYHSAYRHVGGDPKQALAEFERTGRISWTSDLADIPAQYGTVDNVYGDVGQLFATTVVAEPNVCAALMGTLLKGLGADHVCWGTDALWTGAPQWQIEGLRRLEIPEAPGFTPLRSPPTVRPRPPSSAATMPSSTTSSRSGRCSN